MQSNVFELFAYPFVYIRIQKISIRVNKIFLSILYKKYDKIKHQHLNHHFGTSKIL